MLSWFKRFADVPDVGYPGSPDVDRRLLPGHNAVPKVEHHVYEGKRITSFSWETTLGGSSASPAQAWESKPKKGETPAKTALRIMYEKLELPGSTRDYHFALQTCYSELWGYREEANWVLPVVEELCWFDIRLIEAHPKTITDVYNREPIFYSVIAFERLIRLYERNGYLHEALDVATRAKRFEQNQHDYERIAKQIHELEAEEL